LRGASVNVVEASGRGGAASGDPLADTGSSQAFTVTNEVVAHMNDRSNETTSAPSAKAGRTGSEARRGVVKGMALGLGGITLTQWSKPVVESVILPAHAQTTGPVTRGRVITGTSAGGTGAITFP
jgi:hypothetical protein